MLRKVICFTVKAEKMSKYFLYKKIKIPMIKTKISASKNTGAVDMVAPISSGVLKY